MAATRPFVCAECGQTFKTAQGLGLHRNRAHGVVGSSPAAVAKRKARGKRELGPSGPPTPPPVLRDDSVPASHFKTPPKEAAKPKVAEPVGTAEEQAFPGKLMEFMDALGNEITTSPVNARREALIEVYFTLRAILNGRV